MSTSPNFGNAPYVKETALSGANAAYDGTGTLTTIATPPSTSAYVAGPTEAGGVYTAANSVSQPSNGLRINQVIFAATGKTVAGQVCVWVNDGTTDGIVATGQVSAITTSATVAPARIVIDLDLSIPVGATLKATTTAANTFRVGVFGEVL
jgi:hypothetical protein